MSDVSSMAAAFTQISSMKLGNEIATRVAVKAQDAAKAQGQAAISLLQGALEIQQQAVARARQGGGLDVTA
jgi:hypothetical protein